MNGERITFVAYHCTITTYNNEIASFWRITSSLSTNGGIASDFLSHLIIIVVGSFDRKKEKDSLSAASTSTSKSASGTGQGQSSSSSSSFFLRVGNDGLPIIIFMYYVGNGLKRRGWLREENIISGLNWLTDGIQSDQIRDACLDLSKNTQLCSTKT